MLDIHSYINYTISWYNCYMDKEEILLELHKLVNRAEGDGEQIFYLARELERINIFEAMREIMMQKQLVNDTVAEETIAWLWQTIAESY